MANLYLGLGTNQGDRQFLLKQAIDKCSEHFGTVLAVSHTYQTAAWGLKDQPHFLNQCAHFRTELTPEQCLDVVLEIERELGRERKVRWGPRSMDIDLLFYDNLEMETIKLSLPHPYVQERRFVLRPLADIAPELIHPAYGKTIMELLASCPDTGEVHLFTPPPAST